MRGEDTDREPVVGFRGLFLAIAIRKMFNLLHSRVSHVYLTDGIHVVGALEVEEHFSDQYAPALFRMTVFDFRQPALYRRFIVFSAQQ